MEIISAEIADNQILTTITKKSKAYWGYSADKLQGWEHLLTVTKDYIEKNNVFKLILNDQIIGYYSFYPIDENTIKLDNMFILPEYIGKGFGKVLMTDFLKKVEQFGVNKITLDAEPNAENYYKTFDFETTEQLESSIKERYLPIMELKIEKKTKTNISLIIWRM
jgi:GNAT superfamily N-acetyltransferase